MILRTLELRHFRGIPYSLITVNPGVNLLLGPNGAGKTNWIEALCMLTTGLSPHGLDCESLVEWNHPGFSIRGVFSFEDEKLNPLTLEMKYLKGSSRQIRINGQKTVKLRELIGKVPLVSFVPEDLSLVKGEPELRRRSVNLLLMQVDSRYAEDLKRYQETVRSRNAALKQVAERRLSWEAVEPWDDALIRFGLAVCRRRAVFVNKFSDLCSRVVRRVSEGGDDLTIHYRPSFDGPWDDGARDRWRGELLRLRSRDIILGVTTMGPHRDDFSFLLNGRLAKYFASEGQQRTCAVAFKLAEIPFIQEKLGQKPICLLDDVFSELDGERARRLLDELSLTGQFFVSLTGLESWPKPNEVPAAILLVERGQVRRKGEESPTGSRSEREEYAMMRF